jgi:MoaA/NifB/PqqE/SkfB family radical SAM enzyme
MSIHVKTFIPGPETWKVSAREESYPSETDVAAIEAEPTIFVSPDFQLPDHRVFQFKLNGDIEGVASVTFGVRDSRTNKWMRYATANGSGPISVSVPMSMERRHDVHFALEVNSLDAKRPAAVGRLALEQVSGGEATKALLDDTDTYLTHWGPIKRWIHRKCKSSRNFNNVVAYLEMHLSRTELVSLPQYMAFCPTGQCNALCDFCSVTVNRTGIVKRQLPLDRIHAMYTPVVKVARMFGLEGNGEPTLYSHFDELTEGLTSYGGTVYLITNGSRLRREQIKKIATFNSVNFSLNAATAESHRRIMKLKNFDHILEMIKELVKTKQENGLTIPAISASIVVTNDSIHEVQQFMALAEHELGVDAVYIRPLSEVATELGAVEDFRNLVPYDSDVQDVLGAVEDYLRDAALGQTEFHVGAAAFRSVRPDPPDLLPMPLGYEHRLLAPRSKQWIVDDRALSVRWKLNTVRLDYTGRATGVIWRSEKTPVMPDRTITFTATVRLRGGPVRCIVRDDEGKPVAEQRIAPSDEPQTITLSVATGEHRSLALAFAAEGVPFAADIDFERLRTPGKSLRKEFKLPHRDRWEKQMPGAEIAWLNDTTVHVRWGGASGPYLLKCYSVPTVRGEDVRLPIVTDVAAGTLVIGVLNEDFSKWHQQFPIGPGRAEKLLDFNVGDNNRVQIVLFARGGSPLDATIDWQGCIEPPPSRSLDRPVEKLAGPASAPIASASSEAGATPVPAETPSALVGSLHALLGAVREVFAGPEVEKPAILHRLVWGRSRFLCQKPWTDLANFSVDGRMDVCCIATGPSQEKFALGNLLFQSFQEVWNGRMAREFRRTVNSKQPLTPCARCPMTHAYQSPLFDPALTLFLVYRAIYSWPKIMPLRNVRGGVRIAKAIYWPLHLLIHLTVLRGFKRRWLWKEVTRRSQTSGDRSAQPLPAQ